MYDNSDDAIEDNAPVSVRAAQAELVRHGARVIREVAPGRIEVTNDIDPAEVIDCRTGAILIWLGY